MYFIWYFVYGLYAKVDGVAANGWFKVGLTDSFTDAKLCVKTEFYRQDIQNSAESMQLNGIMTGIDSTYYILPGPFWFIVTGIVWKAK